jgi:HD-GYP domain-containing protein (c-di-GMP phosphodiesterase class II)
MSKAAPGMTLALTVLHPEKPGHILLKPGWVLDEKSIERLRELGVRRIGIEFPPTAFLKRYTSLALVNEQSRVAARVAEEVDRMSTGLHAEFEMQPFVDGVRHLIECLVDEPAAALFMNDIVEPRPPNNPIAAHAFNVGLLSLLMGLKLDGYLVAHRTRITQRRQMNIEGLGLGAMLHDVGLTRLPREVAERFERTRDENDEEWRKHVLVGFTMVKGKLPATASATVLHHHQRMDGSGFPARTRGFGPPTALRGEEIHVFARIVALADVFDRLRNPPGHSEHIGKLLGGPVPTVRALRQTLGLVRQGKLDSVVFKALLAVVPAFPPGSIVTLSDGRKAVVTGWDPTQPCSPMVSVLPISLDESLDEMVAAVLDEFVPLGEELDLKDRRDLRIAKIDGHDVTGDLFEPVRPADFDLRLTFPTPIGEGWESIVEQTITTGGKIG